LVTGVDRYIGAVLGPRSVGARVRRIRSGFLPWVDKEASREAEVSELYAKIGKTSDDHATTFINLTQVLGESRRPRVVFVVEPAVVVKAAIHPDNIMKTVSPARDLPGKATALQGRPTRRWSLSRNRILTSGYASSWRCTLNRTTVGWVQSLPEPRHIRSNRQRS
jgi:hypothetical protein